jgi:hypothetical protein
MSSDRKAPAGVSVVVLLSLLGALGCPSWRGGSAPDAATDSGGPSEPPMNGPTDARRDGGGADHPLVPDGRPGDGSSDAGCTRGCCRNEDCPAMTGRTATCDLAMGQCRYACLGDTVECNGKCIARTACCMDRDCPMKDGLPGKCDQSTNQCSWMCASGTTPCAGRCIPTGGCCESCPGNFACVANACSTTTCRDGYTLSGGSCIRQCTACNTSPHCDASAGNVIMGRCDTTTGMCMTTTVTACAGGRSCQGGQCVCPAGRTWNDTACVFTCPTCNTSPHCDNGNVAVGRCNTATGACDKSIMTACSGGRTCQGAACVCSDGRTWNGTACVLGCTGCNTSAHCDATNANVVTGRCDTSNGMCVTTVMTACTGGRTCQGAQCVCTGGRTWNGSACVFTCPTCNTNRRCGADGNLILTETCNQNTGACEPMRQNCGGKGCNQTTLQCNMCSSNADCGLCKQCNTSNGRCESFDQDPACGDPRPGGGLGACRECQNGSCVNVPASRQQDCDSGAGYCTGGMCYYCGFAVNSDFPSISWRCCPAESGKPPCNNCGTGTNCSCGTDNRCYAP